MDVLTLGVEEEYLLLDPVTGRNMPVAEQVYAALSPDAAALSRREFRHSMVEMVTPVCETLPQVRRNLLALRLVAARAATTTGAQLVAIGATPVGDTDDGSPTIPGSARSPATTGRSSRTRPCAVRTSMSASRAGAWRSR